MFPLYGLQKWAVRCYHENAALRLPKVLSSCEDQTELAFNHLSAFSELVSFFHSFEVTLAG